LFYKLPGGAGEHGLFIQRLAGAVVSLAVDYKHLFKPPLTGIIKKQLQGTPGLIPRFAVQVYRILGTKRKKPPPVFALMIRRAKRMSFHFSVFIRYVMGPQPDFECVLQGWTLCYQPFSRPGPARPPPPAFPSLQNFAKIQLMLLKN
jgi:hypothetical protein